MRVRYALRARADLDTIYTYIDKRNPTAARAIKRAIQQSAELLADFPRLGVQTDRSSEFYGIRAGRYPYRIYYRIRADEVWIVHIRDVRRRSWEAEGD
jgi:toxin ParE1/3/4